jgi:hypothetical protein
MTPRELLDEAQRLLTEVVPGTRGRWPRACAWLIRLALERALDQYWESVLPEAASCSMRAQLLLLPAYAGAEIAQKAADAWFGLARAAHHHAYELAPTAAELRDWHTTVTQLTADLDARGKTRAALSRPGDRGGNRGGA